MIKITVEGQNAHIVSSLVTKALREAGIKTNHHYYVTPAEVANCRRDAARDEAHVSVVAMTR